MIFDEQYIVCTLDGTNSSMRIIFATVCCEPLVHAAVEAKFLSSADARVFSEALSLLWVDITDDHIGPTQWDSI